MLGGAFGCDEVVRLLRAERGRLHQAHHAQHAVEGRAQLVAHVGQELAFAAVGGFGAVLRLAQLVGQFFQGSAFLLHAALTQRKGHSGKQQKDQLAQSQPNDLLVLLHQRLLLTFDQRRDFRSRRHAQGLHVLAELVQFGQ